MGRVYKALVRAEKAGIGERKIGRPDPARTPVPLKRTTISSVIARPTEAQTPIAKALDANAEKISRVVTGRALQLQVAQRNDAPKPSTPAAMIDQRTSFEEPLEIRDIRELPSDPILSVLIREDAAAIEQYQKLAARLLHFTEHRRIKTVLITSAEPGEGKTSVALGAAWAAAKLSSNRVLLVDANPDHPSVASLLGISAAYGWSNLTDGSCETRQAMIRIDPNGLYILTLGQSAGGIDVLSATFREMITTVGGIFDIVIVDSPAILESSCAQRLAETLDGTVIVARAAGTDRSKVAGARRLVPKQRRLGVVLNQIEPALIEKRSRRSLVGKLFGRKK